jgi:hypothetical protein
MSMNIVIVKGLPKKFNEQLNWCKENFGLGKEVIGPTQAGLHRWSYELIGFGLRQLYFRDDSDYTLYLLRWS